MKINEKTTNTDNTNSTATAAADTATGAEQEQTTEKTFTQSEVNSIVSDRLRREKESILKQLEQREKAVQARENKLECVKWLNDNGYPTELTEIFNADSTDEFITSVSAMVEKFPDFYKKTAANASEQSEETATTGAEQNGGKLPNGFHRVNSFHPYDSNPNASPLREDEESGKIRRAFGID